MVLFLCEGVVLPRDDGEGVLLLIRMHGKPVVSCPEASCSASLVGVAPRRLGALARASQRLQTFPLAVFHALASIPRQGRQALLLLSLASQAVGRRDHLLKKVTPVPFLVLALEVGSPCRPL